MKLTDYLQAQAQRHPDHEAVVCAGERVTFGELADSVERLASGLHRQGLRPGDRIGIALPNGVDFVRVFLAACRLGVLTVPINLRLSDDEIAYLIADSSPRVLATTVDRWRSLRPTLTAAPAVVLADPSAGEHSLAALGRSEPADLPDLSTDTDDCVICYTSGTTGRPKGAVLTHSNYVVAHGYLNAVSWAMTASDRTLVTTSMAHRTGLARIVNTVCLGSTVVIMPKFEVADAARLIAEERITVLGMVPTVGRMLIDHVEQDPAAFESLRMIIGTGEAFPPDLAERFESAVPGVRVHAFFAMTEVGQIAALDPDERQRGRGSVGRPVPGLEVRLVDADGAPVPVGEAGEIHVRSGRPGQFLVMREYYNLPETTSQVLRNGWLATGDMGRFDTDGFLYIVDRKTDMVLSGGYNIYSREVEDAIRELPTVVDVAVVGVPDDLYGESVAAFVELRTGDRLSEAEVVTHCRSRLASYKKPRYVEFVEELPRNATGKVLKNALRTLPTKQ